MKANSAIQKLAGNSGNKQANKPIPASHSTESKAVAEKTPFITPRDCVYL